MHREHWLHKLGGRLVPILLRKSVIRPTRVGGAFEGRVTCPLVLDRPEDRRL
jgi:hypothetical protein